MAVVFLGGGHPSGQGNHFDYGALALLAVLAIAYTFLWVRRRRPAKDLSGSIAKHVSSSNGDGFLIRADPPRLSSAMWRISPLEFKWFLHVITGRDEWLITVLRGIRKVHQEIVMSAQMDARMADLVREFTES